MSGQVTILQLPTASALTGSEPVPVVQNGVTVQTTTGAIAGAGALNYPFITIGSTSGLTTARQLLTTTGLSLTDSGAGGTVTINMTGSASSLNAASTGFIVKDSASTVTSRSFAVGSGMTISNADGISGNPTFGLSTILQNLASTLSAGMLSLNGTTITAYTLQGTTNQISMTNGNGVGGAPTVGLASNPVVPGTGSITVPSGTTAQRSGSNGSFRYNSQLAVFEGYANGAWGSIATGSGVTSVATGTGLTGGPITSTGTISIADTGVTATSYTNANITVNAQGSNNFSIKWHQWNRDIGGHERADILVGDPINNYYLRHFCGDFVWHCFANCKWRHGSDYSAFGLQCSISHDDRRRHHLRRHQRRRNKARRRYGRSSVDRQFGSNCSSMDNIEWGVCDHIQWRHDWTIAKLCNIRRNNIIWNFERRQWRHRGDRI